MSRMPRLLRSRSVPQSPTTSVRSAGSARAVQRFIMNSIPDGSSHPRLAPLQPMPRSLVARSAVRRPYFLSPRRRAPSPVTFGAVEGTDYMSLRGPAGVVYDLFVDPARRRKGIGRLLMRAGLSSLEKMGAERVVLSTAHRNDAAQALFTSLGFRPTMVEMTRESGNTL